MTATPIASPAASAAPTSPAAPAQPAPAVGRRIPLAPAGAPDAEAQPTGVVLLTPELRDPEYDEAVIESVEDVPATDAVPVPMRVIRGRVEPAGSRFAVYLPPADTFQGRFFQFTYPIAGEDAKERALAFAPDAGGYTVQASAGGGYRHVAAATRGGRILAAEYYGLDDAAASRIHGYLYGPSGGSFQTVGAMESTRGIWEGFVPTVIGVPTSLMDNFFIRAFARLALREAAPAIAAAVDAGTDPHEGLTALQAEVLDEVTELGIPLLSWTNPGYIVGDLERDGRPNAGCLTDFANALKLMDPGYAEAFWSEPGYEGAEDSPLGELLRSRLVDGSGRVERVLRGDDGAVRAAVVTGLPSGTAEADNLDISLEPGADGAAAAESEGSPAEPVRFVGHAVRLAEAALLDAAEAEGALPEGAVLLVPAPDAPVEAVSQLAAGAGVHVDNRWDLAVRLHHRHQVPAAADGYDVFDRLRGADGEPLRPQRPFLAASVMGLGVTGGATHSGRFEGRAILASSLEDSDAFAWHADWYRRRVAAAMGEEEAAARLRVYYSEHADHHDGPVSVEKRDRLVSYDAMVEQALRDLAAWCEDGVEPPASSAYTVSGGQVSLPASASERHGQQPVVCACATVSDGVAQLRAVVDAPVGRVVEAAWWLEGESEEHALELEPAAHVDLGWEVPGLVEGEHVVVVSVASARGGAGDLTRVPNLARVAVTVGGSLGCAVVC